MRIVHPILIECVRDDVIPNDETLARFAAVIAEDVDTDDIHHDDRPIMAWARCALEGMPPQR